MGCRHAQKRQTATRSSRPRRSRANTDRLLHRARRRRRSERGRKMHRTFRRQEHRLQAVALSNEFGGQQAMDKDRVEGAVHQAKGAVKEAIGKVTGDTKTEAEGTAEKTAGKVQNAV